MLLSKLTIFWLLVDEVRFSWIKESVSNPTKTHYIRNMRLLPVKVEFYRNGQKKIFRRPSVYMKCTKAGSAVSKISME